MRQLPLGCMEWMHCKSRLLDLCKHGSLERPSMLAECRCLQHCTESNVSNCAHILADVLMKYCSSWWGSDSCPSCTQNCWTWCSYRVSKQAFMHTGSCRPHRVAQGDDALTHSMVIGFDDRAGEWREQPANEGL